MDCTTILDGISTIRMIVTFGPPILGTLIASTSNVYLAPVGVLIGGPIGYMLNIISKLPMVEGTLIKIMGFLSGIGECS